MMETAAVKSATIIENSRVTDIVNSLSLEEKARLCLGNGNWFFRGIEKSGLKEITVSDGPHGLRKVAVEGSKDELPASVPATCFPTAAGLAASWNRELIGEIGSIIEEEAADQRISIVLGPGINIKRNPLCGRNFEYLSEDPFAAGELAASMIEAIQANGTGTSLKHFATNNQESYRMTVDAIIDERTLREIYLAGFERAVKKSAPWTLMCAYNRLNGEYLSDNKKILSDILRDEWGFEGIVISDWGAVNDRVKSLEAGLEIEMPYSGRYNVESIKKAVEDGTISEEILDRAVSRIIKILIDANNKLEKKESGRGFDVETHHSTAKKAAGESIVLLKNENNTLPLKENEKIAVIGEFAKKPRYQGAGSSRINPTKIDNFLDKIKESYPDAIFSDGYTLSASEQKQTDDQLINQAVEAAEKADKIIVLCGLPDEYESEGFDRKNMKMPETHNRLVSELAKTGKPVVVCLSNGSPVEMPWNNDVAAIIESYLHGQAGAGALADIITGKINPSGKLSESFPIKLEDCPSSSYFPQGPRQVEYREGIYVGYRYYDTANVPVLFPFGHGLSYTSFEYSNLSVSKNEIINAANKASFNIEVKLNIKNTGNVSGKEIVQIYIASPQTDTHKPAKELKGFDKVELEAGEEKEISIQLDYRSFAYWSTYEDDWKVDSGAYKIIAAASSIDTRLSDIVNIDDDSIQSENLENIKLAEYKSINNNADAIHNISDNCFEEAIGYKLPENVLNKNWNRTTTIYDFRATWIGEILYKGSKKVNADFEERIENSAGMFEAQAREMPLRAIAQFSGDLCNMEMIDAFILLGKGKFFKGIGNLIKAYIKLKRDRKLD